VGVTDNFFSLGGHSLLATKLISKTNQRYNIALTVKDSFEHQSVKDLSTYVDEELDLMDLIDNQDGLNEVSESEFEI
jgi:hypothetical protein